MCPGCAHLQLEFPGAKRVGSSEQAKPGGGSFHGERKVTYLSTKTTFRKITLCCVFLVPLSSARSVLRLPPLSGTAKHPGHLPRPGVGLSQSVVAGRDPGGCLQRSPPEQSDHHSVPGRTRALPRSDQLRAGPLFTLRQLSLLAEAVAAQAKVAPSLEGRLELTGVKVGRGKCRGGRRKGAKRRRFFDSGS